MPEASGTTSVGGAKDDFIRSEPGRSSANRAQSYADPIFESSASRRETTQQVAKLTGRLNASTVTDTERNDLLAERTQLLQKSLEGALTRKEEIRLEYVRWSLDRIEDAKHGEAMDRLESHIDEFKRLANRLMGLRDNLDDLARRKRR